MWLLNGQVEDSTAGDLFFYPLTGTEHGSQPRLTTRDKELVSVLEVRIEPGDVLDDYVRVFLLDMTNPSWWREKVMVYYYD